MRPVKPSCCICAVSDEVTGLVVADRQLYLCMDHRQVLGERRPESFDDLVAFFSMPGLDRRKLGDRRKRERRLFPPRPEGRRHNRGRRPSDPEA